MKLPKINDTITTSQALALCQHYGYIHLIDRINRNKNGYKQWRFDGASMVPDRLAMAFFNLPNLIEIALNMTSNTPMATPATEQKNAGPTWSSSKTC